MQSIGMGIGIALGVAVVIGLAAGMLVARALKKKRGDKDSQSGSRMSVTSIEIMELDEEKPKEEKSNVEIVSCIEEGDATFASENTTKGQQVDIIIPAPAKSQSLPSKRRRRRKKKKKKKTQMALTRSNSVNSMDTITEEQEGDEDSYEGSDWGSDWGSEYSTDDEDQDCQMKRTMSTGSLSTDPSLATLSFPLEQVVESPRIRKLPPPPV
jgi:hypothetical protein